MTDFDADIDERPVPREPFFSPGAIWTVLAIAIVLSTSIFLHGQVGAFIHQAFSAFR